ncbi:hypothetical protein ACMXKO_05760 [Clostridium tyrobutyricum]|uniref:hypothetical protein n=1 Tax=Clostridium tyrobutyricum TaxID=1519 RepID=UPI0039F665CF
MVKIVYKCLNEECNTEFIENHKDGLCCPKCGSSVIPIGDAWHYNEIVESSAYKKNLHNKQLKEKYKKQICDLIDKCDLETIDFYAGEYSNIFEKGINFSIEGAYKTEELNNKA